MKTFDSLSSVFSLLYFPSVFSPHGNMLRWFPFHVNTTGPEPSDHVFLFISAGCLCPVLHLFFFIHGSKGSQTTEYFHLFFCLSSVSQSCGRAHFHIHAAEIVIGITIQNESDGGSSSVSSYTSAWKLLFLQVRCTNHKNKSSENLFSGKEKNIELKDQIVF